MYWALDGLVGADDGKRRTWMSEPSTALGEVPIKFAQKEEGLVATLN